MVSSSPENNPEGNPDISSHFRLDEFCELGEDAAKFDEAGACFQRDVEKLIEEANEKVGGMDIDDFKERMDALRPAGHDRERGGGGTTFEYPHRPAAVSQSTHISCSKAELTHFELGHRFGLFDVL